MKRGNSIAKEDILQKLEFKKTLLNKIVTQFKKFRHIKKYTFLLQYVTEVKVWGN